MEYSFHNWMRRRHHLAPEADRILPLLKAASTMGMSRKQIGNAVDLDRDTLDALLGAMVSAGMLLFSWEARGPVYRATGL